MKARAVWVWHAKLSSSLNNNSRDIRGLKLSAIASLFIKTCKRHHKR